MAVPDIYITFRIKEQNLAIDLRVIESIVLSVEISSISQSPEYIAGSINYHGTHIPVIDLKYLLFGKSEELNTSDHFLILNISSQLICLWVDEVLDTVKEREMNNLKMNQFHINNQLIRGVLQLNDNIIFLHDINDLIESEDYKKFHKHFQTKNKSIK